MQRDRSAVCEDRVQLREMASAAPTEHNQIEQVWQWFRAGFGYVGYCGRFSVENGQVHHHVETSLIPQWVGTTLTRDIEWHDDQQELHLLATGNDMSDCLQWRRMDNR